LIFCLLCISKGAKGEDTKIPSYKIGTSKALYQDYKINQIKPGNSFIEKENKQKKEEAKQKKRGILFLETVGQIPILGMEMPLTYIKIIQTIVWPGQNKRLGLLIN
jgi:hypothetical protein